MSKATLAIIAASSAAAGAALTAVIFSSTRSKPASTPSSKSSVSRTSPAPPSPIPITTAQRHSTTAAAPVNPSGIFQYGFPGPHIDINTAPSLTSGYDRRTRNPHWVAEHITPTSLATRSGDRKNSAFFEDGSIPALFRARLHDYARSGFDRGHQVPAADAKWSQEAMDATFALSNMAPQVGEGFNRDYWAHLEDFCRRLTGRYDSVRIVTGPLYLPRRTDEGKWEVRYEVIGNPPNVAVPTHFYKVIFAEDQKDVGKVALAAFVLPNARISNETSLRDFEVPLSVVERSSGLEFANLLEESKRKKLCEEVKCEILVKDYKERQKSFSKMR